MATKLKLVYAGDEPGHEHIIELWTDGPHAAAGHVLDALTGSYSESQAMPPVVPMRIEITPNTPDTPEVRPIEG